MQLPENNFLIFEIEPHSLVASKLSGMYIIYTTRPTTGENFQKLHRYLPGTSKSTKITLFLAIFDHFSRVHWKMGRGSWSPAAYGSAGEGIIDPWRRKCSKKRRFNKRRFKRINDGIHGRWRKWWIKPQMV